MNTTTILPKLKIPEFKVLDRLSLPAKFRPDTWSDLETESSVQLNNALVEECIGGVLVFTAQSQLVYASTVARQVMSQLQPDNFSTSPIPHEIGHICQSLIQSRHLFPDQNWIIEFDIFTHTATTLHICSRWINLDKIGHPYLLLTIEDRQQAIVNLVLDEANRYGLTPREKDVWLLQYNNYTYKQIAAELGITPNTVKKHMRSIYAKKKSQQESSSINLTV
jgi:DNA-binding CsgD family transcriptional regulator